MSVRRVIRRSSRSRYVFPGCTWIHRWRRFPATECDRYSYDATSVPLRFEFNASFSQRKGVVLASERRRLMTSRRRGFVFDVTAV